MVKILHQLFYDDGVSSLFLSVYLNSDLLGKIQKILRYF